MKIIVALLSIALLSCKNQKSSEADGPVNYKKSSLLDSSNKKQDTTRKTLKKEDYPTDYDYIYWDTVGVADAPVKVLKAWFTRRDYSSYRDIAVRYKSASNKKITAIRFSWYGETAFGDPADMGASIKSGFGGGFTEYSLAPGQTRTSEWSILSRNGKKVVMAWPTEIMFEDGTKWKSTYKSLYE